MRVDGRICVEYAIISFCGQSPFDNWQCPRATSARLAASRVILCAAVPAVTATLLGLLLEPIGDFTWGLWDYQLAPERADALSLGLIAAGMLVFLVGCVMAFRAYRRANDFLSAAAELDTRLECNQEILTLATLVDPKAPDSNRGRRSPLFPVLWRRAVAMFVGFDPREEFKLEVGEPLKRSSIFAGAVVLAMIVATLGLVRAPTPENIEAVKLRTIAEAIAKSSTSPDDAALAAKIREAANALENPKVPPQEKKQRIEEAKQQAEKAAEKRNNSNSGKGQGTGKSNSQTGAGTGQGKGQSQNQAGGTGSGAGKSSTNPGNNQGGANSGKNEGGKGGKESAKNDKNQNKGDESNVELQNELAKAEAQVETADAKNPSPQNQPGDDKTQSGSKAGNNPNQQGPKPNPNAPGEIPRPGAKGDKNIPATGGSPKNNKDMGSNLGDTHLGEMPTSTNAQRYLKPGEKGAAVDIKDARYVMFRLPGASPSDGGGKTVLDTERPKASTGYVNAPLAPTSADAPPDERQLVPPRYRDMIH